MNINLNSGHVNVVVNGILSGFYGLPVTGLRKRLFQFSSPAYPIGFFTSPYDAKLVATTGGQTNTVAVGEGIKVGCTTSSDRTGVLYYYDSVNIVGACHGYGHENATTHYSGHNFYNAFYAAGYFAPPFGENISIFKSNSDGFDNLSTFGCGVNMSVTDYNELFGIVSQADSCVNITTNTLAANSLSPILSPQEACPPLATCPTYYNEVNYQIIAGTISALAAGDPYNGNPIPTALDAQDIRVDGRYELLGSANGPRTGIIENNRVKPSYTSDSIRNKLNTTLCPATSLETRVAPLRGSNGLQLMNAPDMLLDDLGGQVSFVGQDQAQYWHFTFRENTDGFPFSNNFIPSLKLRRNPSKGTQLFDAKISHQDMYWENRQCPATVDFLPYTFGGAIYACPSEHFDIPYYAAIKKYGFYGTRFFNTCKALNLTQSLSGVTQAAEIDMSTPPIIAVGENEPDDLDKDGNVSFSAFSNLLRTAKAEERYSNMYALNKGFFLWANRGGVTSGFRYAQLSNIVGFTSLISGLFRNYDEIFASGMSSFTGNEPNVVLLNVAATSFQVVDSGIYSDALLTNKHFTNFKNRLRSYLTGVQEMNWWEEIESGFAYYVANIDGSVNQSFYDALISGREKRIRTRYFENILRGNPVDLFPLNSITFATDQAKDYLESESWGRKTSTFGLNSDLPEIPRRYFEGAYGETSQVTGLIQKLNALPDNQFDSYYPGFFNNINCGREQVNPSYVKVLSGQIRDGQNRPFSPSGWLAVGYHEVGKLDGNFSCFTPIFTQQPLPKVITKIGQAATFRTTAVDYHTIPEDKLNKRYPEILFWGLKLKLLDCNLRTLYPLKYRWFRVPKTNYSSFFSSGDFYNYADWSSPTGSWACQEGDGKDCTVIHPTECSPTGVLSADDYTFMKGAQTGIDDQYYYFCLASGRFGIRISNPSEMVIENWIKFDVSARNGMNAVGALSVSFEGEDKDGGTKTITVSSTNMGNYQGYKYDPYSLPESRIEQKVPPPNAGFGDVAAVRFIGPVGYIGELRTWAPSYLTDNRGLRETWGHMLDYGPLYSFTKVLSQSDGDFLYGYKHLPTCSNYDMPQGKQGIRAYFNVAGTKVSHWSLDQNAVASSDNTYGIRYDKLLTIGDLYPPISRRNESPNFGIGHWQFQNNMGAIKKFGWDSDEDDIDIDNGGGQTQTKDRIIQDIKKNLLKSTDLAGDNCGYIPYGAGRYMLFHMEAFERFYILCDAVKKKNVTNRSFISPGLRLGNSAIQYFWLGKPRNTYLSRKSMYGPYAFQWKVNRHNRDRNGNGISEGFYSMGWDEKYSMMYDAPAIFGLYVRNPRTSQSYQGQVERVNRFRRSALAEGIYIKDLRNWWFGESRGEGTARNYGDYMFSCDPSKHFYSPLICEYVEAAKTLAGSPNVTDYGCPEDKLSEGRCFDPCLSMRWAQGFFPGGKALDMFGYQPVNSTSDDPNVRIVANTIIKNGRVSVKDEKSPTDSNTYLRSPVSTPYGKISRVMYDNMGVSPCQDGGADHCNYMTPLVSLGKDNYLLGRTTEFNFIANLAGNAV